MWDMLGIVQPFTYLSFAHNPKRKQRFIDLFSLFGKNIGQELQIPHLRTTAFRRFSDWGRFSVLRPSSLSMSLRPI